jgi:hypothetical protein
MKAAILEKGKLEIREVPKPTPKNEEALVTPGNNYSFSLGHYHFGVIRREDQPPCV